MPKRFGMLFGTKSSTSSESIFKHVALDRSQRSLRLLRVLPSLSSNGLIRCQIWHSTITAAYACLSYQWGDESPLYDIELNGRTFAVRANLFNFLVVMQDERSTAQSASDSLWIDAICIDQLNVLERNHQVAQMGKIYSNATRVELWLGGTSPALAPLIQAMRLGAGSLISSDRLLNINCNIIIKCILNNAYFNRAWVTQEILLARRAVARIAMESLDLEHLIAGLKQWPYPEGPSTFDESPFAQFTRQRRTQLERENLLSLLAQFRDRHCAMSRDRIFSLLSLCSDADNKVKVEYRSPAIDLAADVLRSCANSLCICSTILVLQVLDIEKNLHYPSTMSSYTSDTNSTIQIEPCLTFDVSMVHSFHGSGQLLYSHPNIRPNSYELYSDYDDPPPRDTITGRYLPDIPRMCFNIFGTCRSASFLNLFATWQSDGHLGVTNMRWWNEEQRKYFPVDASWSREFSVERSDRGTNTYTIRISFRLLAKLAPDAIDLCTYARYPQDHQRNVAFGQPKIERAKISLTSRETMSTRTPSTLFSGDGSVVTKFRQLLVHSILKKAFVHLGIRYIIQKTRKYIFRQRRPEPA
jgi:hypothetical protein